ncbi:MAG: transglutaminase family protein [Actinomycetota bacterium]|nr:transglutaminase family protein [Actinomycetota bacterium]
MHLTILHSTTYEYDQPVTSGPLEVRLRPQTRVGQRVSDWNVDVEGGTHQVDFEDEHGNAVELISLDPSTTQTTIVASGQVETSDTAGVVSRHRGHAPSWLFQRSTELTEAGEGITTLVGELTEDDELGRLHELSGRILANVAFEVGVTGVASTAEEALAARRGVCQDHSHIFIAAARSLGHPARYVSGYLMRDDTHVQDASHAWAQVWVEMLGWVGFDIANGISPDERYVEVATGLDYRGAAPVSGVRFGDGAETLEVTLHVQQQ